ncbi:MAG: Ig-like domain-containing protein [Chthonomonas sp.]|nr:Ig-like domain-containing protein [Chthonomonas sp.]
MVTVISLLAAVYAPDLNQTEFANSALGRVNELRRNLKLNEVSLDSQLITLASEQCNYLVLNKQLSSHEQQEGKPGFTGKTLADRVKRAQLTWGVSETLNGSKFLNGAQMIDGLLEVPYHRMPFLHPGFQVMGTAIGEFSEQLIGVAHLGRRGGEGVVVYPAADQTGVPLSANTYELPDPLRMHRSRKTMKDANGNILLEEEIVGPFITFNVFPNTEAVAFGQVTLTNAAGEPVPIWVNTTSNDDFLRAAAFITPKKPLAPNTKYTATFSLIGDAAKHSRTWSFTTAAK